uniref:Protein DETOXIFICATION n=1 Tax=Wollemia nobilis TaxID=56998 RepID=A0A0C9RU90_9CONI
MDDQESLRSPLLFSPEDEEDYEIKDCKTLGREYWKESKKLWYLAGPAIFTSLCQYSLGAVTQTFAGHISDVALAAFSIENSVIAGVSFGMMMGMGSALETLCGQAFGAGQLNMLGVYMQRSWLILNSTALVMMSVYILATPILKAIGQEAEIAEVAGKFAVWMIPQLFAYAMNFPLAKFLQAQSKIMVMAVIAGVALALHVLLSWLLIFKAGWGLGGAAFVLDLSWWIIVLSQLGYVLYGGNFKESWTGFSWSAFRELGAFVRLSLASGVMLCLETWYFYLLILLAGYLKNATISVDAISICLNLVGWEVMISIGFNIAISVRVSNELGAGHPKAAKFAMIVVISTTFLIGCILMAIILISRNEFANAFTDSQEVRKATTKLAILLALTMFLNGVQPVLSGVAIGAGWQAVVAYINLGCYYIFGVPIGCLLGYYFGWGVKGIWMGMISGTVLQTLILFVITFRTKWNEEASQAKSRISLWGGKV